MLVKRSIACSGVRGWCLSRSRASSVFLKIRVFVADISPVGVPHTVINPSSAFMNTRKSNGDRALPCATPVSKVIVAHCGSFGSILTVECSYSDTSRSTSGMPYARITAQSAACDIAFITLKAQSVPQESYVEFALLCVDSVRVAQRYYSEVMKYPDYPRACFFDEQKYPPRPESLRFGHFANWLITTFTDAAVAEEQRQKFERLRQSPDESVYMFNDCFNYERELLHELKMASYLTSGAQDSMWDRSMNSEHLCMIVEDERDTL